MFSCLSLSQVFVVIEFVFDVISGLDVACASLLMLFSVGFGDGDLLFGGTFFTQNKSSFGDMRRLPLPVDPPNVTSPRLTTHSKHSHDAAAELAGKSRESRDEAGLRRCSGLSRWLLEVVGSSRWQS